MARRKPTFERTRCIDGRLMRHDPQPDDPNLETDIGECEVCEGEGCAECDSCGKMGVLSRCFAAGGIETFACTECREI
jgi:hypothetical protein